MKLFLSLVFFSTFSFAATAKTSDSCALGEIKKQEMALASENVANANTTKAANGLPYERKYLKCDSNGCAVASDKKIIKKYLPTHPDANALGFVSFPKVNVAQEIATFFKASNELSDASSNCTLIK